MHYRLPVGTRLIAAAAGNFPRRFVGCRSGPFLYAVKAWQPPGPKNVTGEGEIMRKVNVLEFVSLDGVIQAPGGPEEDTSGGFAYGGWIIPHSDAVSSTAIRKEMNIPFDLLLGRQTFDIWAKFWPQHDDIWPAVNTATKYVASNTITSHEWQPSVFLNGDIAESITKLKQQASLS